MKRIILIVILAAGISSLASAQYKVVPNMPFSTLNSNPGFLTINEITGGFGLNGTTYSYSKYFIGLTSVNGYQVNRNFLLGIGTGLYSYESGILVPLFLDFRYAFNIARLTPYLYGDGGLLLNFSDFNTTKLFINPGAGIRYTLNRKTAVNMSVGAMSQVDGRARETFVNVKLGVVYVF